MNWYHAHSGEQQGPFTREQFDAQVAQGLVRDDTLVWHDGLTAWQPWSAVRAAAGDGVPLHPEPAGTTVRCCECGGTFPEEAVVRFGPEAVCESCKPVHLQRILEGAHRPEERVIAGLGRRFLADMIDNLILFLPVMLLSGVLGAMLGYSMTGGGNGGAAGPNISLSVLGIQVAVQIVYLGFYIVYTALLTWRYGHTPGKLAMGLRVIRADGSGMGLGQSFGRALAELLSGLTCYLGYLIAFFDDERRSLHDHICNTRVVRR